MLGFLVASYNKNKVKELKRLLLFEKVVLNDLSDFEKIEKVDEIGKTFTENSILKARSYALQTGLWTIADDSGLEVTSLGNDPGIFSARYAGCDADDGKNTIKLLKELRKKKNTNRTARFICVICVSDKKGEIQFTAEGVCNGRIALNPIGSNGFGYDPVFIPEGYKQTFGQLPSEIKNKISHRAIATKKLLEYLSENLGFLT